MDNHDREVDWLSEWHDNVNAVLFSRKYLNTNESRDPNVNPIAGEWKKSIAGIASKIKIYNPVAFVPCVDFR